MLRDGAASTRPRVSSLPSLPVSSLLLQAERGNGICPARAGAACEKGLYDADAVAVAVAVNVNDDAHRF